MRQSENNLQIREIERKIGYEFSDKNLLATAFTHSSYANEKKLSSNENMEFFGDAILEFLISEYLYRNFPDRNEGDFSKARAAVVSRDSLSEAVKNLGLERFLLISNAQALSTENAKIKLFANLFEAVLCAVYLDGGMQAAEKFVFSHLKKSLRAAVAGGGCANDFKRVLLEYCQAVHTEPEYAEEDKSGPPHDPRYVYSVRINGEVVGRGEGSSKIQAQADAAEKAIKKLGIDNFSQQQRQ
ncbi:MAG: ribonuclease III [Christensenellales bacterium]